MTTHKVYGLCNRCYQGVISVIKSDKVDDSETLYTCPNCSLFATFNFSISDELEKRIKESKKGE